MPSDKRCHGFSSLTKLLPQCGHIGIGIRNVLIYDMAHHYLPKPLDAGRAPKCLKRIAKSMSDRR